MNADRRKLAFIPVRVYYKTRGSQNLDHCFEVPRGERHQDVGAKRLNPVASPSPYSPDLQDITKYGIYRRALKSESPSTYYFRLIIVPTS